MFGCSHKWKVESANYSPPYEGGFKAKSVSPETVQAILEGVTHVYMRCEKCGNLKETRVFGEYKPL